MTLVHSRIVRRLGLKVNSRGGENFDLYDAQGASMVVEGTCVIHVVPEGCTKPRTLKLLVTPSLEEEEILLGWSNIVEWGILKRDFNVLSDEDFPGGRAANVKKTTSTSNLTTSSSIGGLTAVNSNHSSYGSIGQGFFNETNDVDRRLEGVRTKLMEFYDDVFTDELGEDDRMMGDPVQLEVRSDAAAPYHCWTLWRSQPIMRRRPGV